MSHKCPMCQSTILRKKVATCGGIDCIATWRSFTSTQRARMKEAANGDIFTVDEPPTPERQAEIKQKIADALPKKVDEMPEALKSFFGDKKGNP